MMFQLKSDVYQITGNRVSTENPIASYSEAAKIDLNLKQTMVSVFFSLRNLSI